MTTSQDENGAAQADADTEVAELRKTLETPIGRDEAKKEFAEIDVLKAQLRVARQRTLYEITQLQLKVNAIDEQLLAADMQSAIVFRRALNNDPAEPAQE